jgi:hypothetical protein
MVPSKLKHHFETKHNEHKGKPLSFFQHRLKHLSSEKITHTKIKSENENALMVVSMKISYHIARGSEAHTIGENPVKPRAVYLAAYVIDKDAARKIQVVQSSTNVF